MKITTLGCTNSATSPGTKPTTVTIPLAASPPAGESLFLTAEKITATKIGTSGYNLHLNVPSGTDPTAQWQERVGVISLYGLVEATPHGGFNQTFKIDEKVEELRRRGSWNGSRADITIVPIRDVSETDLRIQQLCIVSAKE